MKRIGILSDTHSCWDDRFASHFSDCDEVWHAGDIGDISIIERLQSIKEGIKVRAVAGNIDHGIVRRMCNEIEEFTIEQVKVLITHIGGYPGKYSPGIKRTLREKGIKLMIAGHSHILKVMYDHELEMLHINPGAAGYYGWQQQRTLIKLSIDGATMKDLEVIELGKIKLSNK